MYTAFDDSGNEYLMMDSIVDYWNNDKALSFSSQKMVHSGRIFMQRSTVGWQICNQWRDGLTSWQDIKYLNESHPVVTAEYVMDLEIDHEPALNWWVKAALKNRLSIISLVKKMNS